MNFQKLLFPLPYILLILANFVYIYANGFQQLGHYPELVLYNILFFLLVSVVIILHLNWMLYQWFILEKGDTKAKTKKAIRTVTQKIQFGISCFRPGNQKMILKILLYLQLWGLLRSIIPGFLLTVLIATYFQYKGFLQSVFKSELQQLDTLQTGFFEKIMDKVPSYKQSEMTDK